MWGKRAGWGGGFDRFGRAAARRLRRRWLGGREGCSRKLGARDDGLSPFTARLSAPRDLVKLGKVFFPSLLPWVSFPARFFGYDR